jgi:hypothetical protein
MEVVQTLAFATPRFLSWSYRRAAAPANRLLHSSWSRLQIPTDPQQSQPCPLSGRLTALVRRGLDSGLYPGGLFAGRMVNSSSLIFWGRDRALMAVS